MEFSLSGTFFMIGKEYFRLKRDKMTAASILNWFVEKEQKK